ncbi:MAG: DUF2059 domain-containing protein [Bacteroidota bacterium]
MRKILTTALVLMICTTVFGQAETDEYRKTLKRFFEVSGSQETYQTAIEQMFMMYRQQYSEVDEQAWNALEKEFAKTSLNDLTEMLVPVYSKYMTIEDLQELIRFYETPVGRKFAQNTPLIMQESMQIGQQWGMKIGRELEQRIKENGY